MNSVYRAIAQRTNPTGPNHRQIVFAYHHIDHDASIQTAYGGTSIPTVVMFHGVSVVGRLDDLSERVLEKYIRKNAEVCFARKSILFGEILTNHSKRKKSDFSRQILPNFKPHYLSLCTQVGAFGLCVFHGRRWLSNVLLPLVAAPH
jgi:hypothetical protein